MPLDQSRRVDKPEPGYFRMKAVRNGPLVAARIWDVDGTLHAHLNGNPAGVTRVWEWGKKITEAEYKQLMGRNVDATERCDLTRMPPPF